MNYTIADVSLHHLHEIVKRIAHYPNGISGHMSGIHCRVEAQLLKVFATDGISAGWGIIPVQAGDTESFRVDAKQLLSALKELRKATGRADTPVILSSIDSSMRLESPATGDTLSVPCEIQADRWTWLTRERSTIASAQIDVPPLIAALRGVQEDSVRIIVRKGDDVAKSWMEVAAPGYSTSMDFRRNLSWSLLHTLWIVEHVDLDKPSCHIDFYVKRLLLTLKHVSKRATLKITDAVGQGARMGQVDDEFTTHVMMPRTPIDGVKK